MPGFGILAAVLGIVITMGTVNEGATSGEIAEHVGAAMVGTFIGIFFCYGFIDPLCNMMKQLVSSESVEQGNRQGGTGDSRRRQTAAAGDRRRPPPGGAEHQAKLRPAGTLDQ
jgi:hypothetical protein